MWAKSYPQHCICFTWPLFNSNNLAVSAALGSYALYWVSFSLCVFDHIHLPAVNCLHCSTIHDQWLWGSEQGRLCFLELMSLIACRPSSNFLPPCLESLLTFIVCVQSFLCQLAYCRLTVISSTTVNVYHIPVFPECVRNQRKLILFGVLTRFFPPVLWHCWLGDRKDILSVKKTWCLFVGGDIFTGNLQVL